MTAINGAIEDTPATSSKLTKTSPKKSNRTFFNSDFKKIIFSIMKESNELYIWVKIFSNFNNGA